MKNRLLVTFIALLLLPVMAAAQNATMLSMARTELQKRGLEENEVRERLMQNGIDVDMIQPSEYAAYQSRVMAILDQMQEEKTAKQVATPAASAFGETADEALSPNKFPQTTQGEAAAEAALEDALDKAETEAATTSPADIYGHSLFSGKSMDVYRTTDGAQAPDTYVLGEGDEIHISIFGSSQTEIHQRVSPDGSIQPTGAAKIFVKGLTLAQARSAIRTKLAQHYSFRQDQIAVTITTARTVSVSIYGEVGVQGGFTLSALNNVFNALIAAGGPTDIGSIREIQLSRSGKTSTLDFYKYMTNPTKGVNYDIQNGDVLFVPVAQKVVTIEGAVNRPMRYELVDGETLRDLIAYAGGLAADAFPDFVQVERHENGDVKYLEYNLMQVIDGRERVAMERGDIVRVRTTNKPVENFVAIGGDVYYDGRYDLQKNSSLKGLLQKASPTFTAKTDYVFVERTRPDETIEVITVPYPGVNGNPDFALMARDSVTVLTQSNYRDTDTIEVSGQVRIPFTRDFGLNDRMTVSQAIDYAGGLKTTVFPVAYIFRKDVTNPVKMEYIPINLEKDGDTLLQPGDRLNVYDNTTYTNIGEVRVSGAVKEPVNIAFDSAITVQDLLTMAGGFEVGASYDNVQVYRVNISKSQEPKLECVTIKVDDDYNVIGRFQLQPYDHIVVRMTPNFSQGRTVEVNGRVKYPGSYVIMDSRTTLSEIIKMAGGLMSDADRYATLFRTFNNRGNIGVDLKRIGSKNSDPIMMDGDVINVVREENVVVIREIGTRMAQYVPAEYSSSQTTFVYRGGKNAGWYINQYAGGFDRLADKYSVTVTTPNYQSFGTRKFLGFVPVYPAVTPGSVITLRLDPKKLEKEMEPKEKKEKVDLETTLSKILSSVTSIMSIIILADRVASTSN